MHEAHACDPTAAARHAAKPPRPSITARLTCAAGAVLTVLVVLGSQIGLAARYNQQADDIVAAQKAKALAQQAAASTPRRL